jgi:hypothetical protein
MKKKTRHSQITLSFSPLSQFTSIVIYIFQTIANFAGLILINFSISKRSDREKEMLFLLEASGVPELLIILPCWNIYFSDKNNLILKKFFGISCNLSVQQLH